MTFEGLPYPITSESVIYCVPNNTRGHVHKYQTLMLQKQNTQKVFFLYNFVNWR